MSILKNLKDCCEFTNWVVRAVIVRLYAVRKLSKFNWTLINDILFIFSFACRHRESMRKTALGCRHWKKSHRKSDDKRKFNLSEFNGILKPLKILLISTPCHSNSVRTQIRGKLNVYRDQRNHKSIQFDTIKIEKLFSCFQVKHEKAKVEMF